MVNPFSVACYVYQSPSGCRCPPWPVWWRSTKPCCRLFTYFATDLALVGFSLGQAAVKISEGFPFPTLILVCLFLRLRRSLSLISSPPPNVRNSSNHQAASKQANHDDRLEQNPPALSSISLKAGASPKSRFWMLLLLFTSHSTFSFFTLQTSDHARNFELTPLRQFASPGTAPPGGSHNLFVSIRLFRFSTPSKTNKRRTGKRVKEWSLASRSRRRRATM